MFRYYLYRHIRLDNNEPFYIGIGKKNLKYNSYKSEYSRAYKRSSRNPIWKNIVNKTDYQVEILYESNYKEEIILKEKEFIKLYGRKDNKTGILSNLTDGGDFFEGYIQSEDLKRRKSIIAKGRTISRETVEKIIKTRRENGTYSVSSETREKQSKAKIGKPLTRQSVEKRIVTRRNNSIERGYYISKGDKKKAAFKQRITLMGPESIIKLIDFVESNSNYQIKDLSEYCGINRNTVSKIHKDHELLDKFKNYIDA